jgi:hypothetical protein
MPMSLHSDDYKQYGNTVLDFFKSHPAVTFFLLGLIFGAVTVRLLA